MDGALDPRGAWLHIRRAAGFAIAHNYQLCIHAIGDRAYRETFYKSVFREHPGKKNLCWRVEHAQHLSAADIPRFGQLGVIAAMQAIHCTSDAPYVLRLGPKRAEEGAYAWQKLVKSGAIAANGTDARQCSSGETTKLMAFVRLVLQWFLHVIHDQPRHRNFPRLQL